jgi:hypothetical protein
MPLFPEVTMPLIPEAIVPVAQIVIVPFFFSRGRVQK